MPTDREAVSLLYCFVSGAALLHCFRLFLRDGGAEAAVSDWALSVPHYMRVLFPFVPRPLQVSYSSSSHRRVRSVKYWLCPSSLLQSTNRVGLSTAFCRARSAPFLASPPSSPSHSLWSLFGQSICLSLWSADRTDMHAFILYPSIEDELRRRLGGGVTPNFAVYRKTEEGTGDWRMPLAARSLHSLMDGRSTRHAN